jgi:hypothetical protein
LILEQCLTVNKSRSRLRFKRGKLNVDATRKAPIIVIQKANIVCGAGQDTKVAGARNFLVTLSANPTDPGQSSANVSSSVRRCIVNYYNLDLIARLLSARNRSA